MDNENKKETIKKETIKKETIKKETIKKETPKKETKKETKKEIKKEEIKKEEENNIETSSLEEFMKRGTELLKKEMTILHNDGNFNGENRSRNHEIRKTKKRTGKNKIEIEDRMEKGIREFREDLNEYSIGGKIFGTHSLKIWDKSEGKKKLLLIYTEELKKEN